MTFGALAETWTGEMLRKLRRKGWNAYHGLTFVGDGGPFDIDHVVVGPHGVVAIETKYIGDIDWTPADEPPGYARKRQQARAGARQIRLLLSAGRVRLNVVPVLCLWGPGSAVIDSTRWVDDVLVVPRPTNGEWLSFLPSRIEPGMIDAVNGSLRAFVHRQESAMQSERKQSRKPRRSPRRALRTTSTGV